ncbi:MAG: hypothetical protein B7Z74_04320 [Deltaproteobacteria bacterium 21-66-5]|nr:MAG: hypothetical protein B7Z74_04320 [Deltaproteobacteria bacterium 21-66-5]
MMPKDTAEALLEQAISLKQMAKTTLDAMIAAFELNRARDGHAPRIVTGSFVAAGSRRWRQIDISECPTRGRTRFVYERAGRTPVVAHFCPECWQLEVYDASGAFLAHASRRVEKFLRALPPGSRLVSMTVSGETVACDPPVKPSDGKPG